MRIAVLGASRGLGNSLVRFLIDDSQNHVLGMSRRPGTFENERFHFQSQDFSNLSCGPAVADALRTFAPEKIFYVAGGGPYGTFHRKQWKDHEWALNVSLLFPMALVHQLTLMDRGSWAPQIILLGSDIAENKGDSGAASYSVAKHGLLGLVQSLALEEGPLDVRLFSPGYMDTGLLPPGSRPRVEGRSILDPDHVARALWDWAQSDDPFGHCRYPSLD